MMRSGLGPVQAIKRARPPPVARGTPPGARHQRIKTAPIHTPHRDPRDPRGRPQGAREKPLVDGPQGRGVRFRVVMAKETPEHATRIVAAADNHATPTKAPKNAP